jgi:hypothetical protein
MVQRSSMATPTIGQSLARRDRRRGGREPHIVMRRPEAGRPGTRVDDFVVPPTLAGMDRLTKRLVSWPGAVAVAEPTSMTCFHPPVVTLPGRQLSREVVHVGRGLPERLAHGREATPTSPTLPARLLRSSAGCAG